MNAPRLIKGTRSASQSGVVLLVTLIALVIVLVGALALMRSADTSDVIAGNIAFKRDMTNNAERGAAAAIAQFSGSGLLATAASTYNSNVAANYSATILSTSSNNRGIPDALLNDSLFSTYGSTSNDLTDANSGLSVASGVTIRYIIDRMCSQTGAPTQQTCVLNTSTQDTSGNANRGITPGSYQSVYRISIRVEGPRNTQAFVQTTLGD